MGSLYSLGEALKNRRMISPKYESTMLVFGKKHVIFFANFKPDMKAWSADRYHIIDLGILETNLEHELVEGNVGDGGAGTLEPINIAVP